MTNKITIEVEIPRKLFEDLFRGGFTHEIGYWGVVLESGDVLDGGAVLIAEHDDLDKVDEGEIKPLRLDLPAIRKGLALMAWQWPRCWERLVTECEFSNVLDVLVQLSLFGQVKYG